MPATGSGLSLGRIFGIEIRIDWSWLLIFLLVTFNVYTILPELNGNWSGGLRLFFAVLASALFFLSVLAHELAHSLVSKARGIDVHSITLWLFGGVANITREPPSPGTEFWITIVGPLTSIVLGIIFILLANVSLVEVRHPVSQLRGVGPFTAIFAWLGPVNLILGVFNLVPGFPLDGGRLLRSALWAATGSLDRATRWASWVGQGVGWLFVLAGIDMAFGGRIPFLGTGFVGGLWIAFIGWFLQNAARASYEQVVITHILEGVPVATLMRTSVPTVQAGSSVGDLVHNLMMRTDEHAFPVLEGEDLVGLVCLDDVRRVPRQDWDLTPVRRIMTPISDLATATPREDANDAFSELATRDVNQLPVIQDGRLVGVIGRRDIVRWLQLHRQRGRS